MDEALFEQIWRSTVLVTIVNPAVMVNVAIPVMLEEAALVEEKVIFLLSDEYDNPVRPVTVTA